MTREPRNLIGLLAAINTAETSESRPTHQNKVQARRLVRRRQNPDLDQGQSQDPAVEALPTVIHMGVQL